MKKGFTLIELLVVVLIIGILSAIALPQYRIAIARANFAQLQIFGNAIKTAQESYFLANGEYTDQWDLLDLSFSGTVLGPAIYMNKFSCGMTVDESKIKGEFNCRVSDHTFDGTGDTPLYITNISQNSPIFCRAYGTTQNRVCKSLTQNATNCTPSEGSYCQYTINN